MNPRCVYERLYRAGTAQSGDAAKMDKLLLDRVLDDAKRLRGEVGAADGKRLDEYLSVDALPRAAGGAASAASGGRGSRGCRCGWRTPRPSGPASHEEHCELMLDMIATAFQSDTTRIAPSCSATR